MIERFRQRLLEEARKYKDYADNALASAREKRRLAKEVAKIRGSTWTNVVNIDLKEGRLYVVRRVMLYPKRRVQSPDVQRWTEDGWRNDDGTVSHGTTASSTLQVWVRKKPCRKCRPA